MVVQLSYGFGRPAYYLTPHQFRELSKYAYGEWLQVRQAVFYRIISWALTSPIKKTFATLTFTKVAICLFLLRITVTKKSIRPLQVAVALLVVSNIALSLVWILQCTPHLDKAWNHQMPGKCFSKGQLERIIISQARKYSLLDSISQLTTLSHIYNIGLLPLRLPYPHSSKISNQFPQQGRPLPPHGPRRNHRLPLHSPHCSKLAEWDRRSDLEKYPQLVLALVGSLLRHRCRMYTNSTTRLQMAQGRNTH